MARGPFVARGRENQIKAAVHHAINLVNAGYSPALVGGTPFLSDADVADHARVAAERGYRAYRQDNAIYLERAEVSA